MLFTTAKPLLLLTGLLLSPVALSKKDDGGVGCICPVEKRPGNTFENIACLVLSGLKLKACTEEKAATARWMAKTLSWGTISTISENSSSGTTPPPFPQPFGNVYSFVDGSCDASTGVPFLYGSEMDPTFQQAAKNPLVSFTLSEASYDTVNGCSTDEGGETIKACAITANGGGDPENPPCARLTLIGKFVLLQKDSDEYKFAKDALFQRHPAMKNWPTDHGWLVAKIDVQEAWSISFYGEASVITKEEYFGVGVAKSEL